MASDNTTNNKPKKTIYRHFSGGCLITSVWADGHSSFQLRINESIRVSDADFQQYGTIPIHSGDDGAFRQFSRELLGSSTPLTDGDF